MKVLLLHPDDQPPPSRRWNRIVDLGRAPATTYEKWGRQAGCPVRSLYDYAQEIDDLPRIRELFLQAAGSVVDQHGVDWWPVVSPMLLDHFEQALLLRRLAQEIGPDCQLHSTRAHPLATALCGTLGVDLNLLQGKTGAVSRLLGHYRESLSRLNPTKFAQICQDKFDPEHAIRRRLTRRGASSGQPVCLLPTAYVNVSRTAVAYARLIPDQQFLLVLARRDGRLQPLPPNVRMISLDPYFDRLDTKEAASLSADWENVRQRLAAHLPEFTILEALGALARVPSLLRWGLVTRDAWNRLFDSENVQACLSADNFNPYSSIPLLLAKQRGLPALACHHGALDWRMAIRPLEADFYLAKGEMEQDFLVRQCHVAADRIVVGGPEPPAASAGRRQAAERPWLVFFTEPYAASGWRNDEVYRDLLPRLWSLSQACGLQLVFKLHPFETVRGHRRLLRKLLPQHAEKIHVIAGTPSSRLWQNMSFAITVQSSVALECSALGVPVFLCAWLRSPHANYVSQFDRFGMGRVLESPDKIAEIPQRLNNPPNPARNIHQVWQGIRPEHLYDLLARAYAVPVPIRA